jgi:spermidine synthase
MTRWFRPAVFAAALVPILATPLVVLAIQPSIYTERTFYGVFTVSRENGMHVLTHGATYHGSQFEDDELAKEPTSYYNRQGPLGDAVEACRKLTGCKRIGVIGLGTGSIAAYGQPGDDMTFYEIDPAIIDIAKDSRFFSYLSDSQAQVRTVPGDGRLSLAADDAKYDLLVIDAFSSDAIPMHLLTTEALGLYKTKLNPGGLLALHISNRNLLLEPIVQAGAKAQHMEALTRYDPGRQSPEGLHLASLWMVLAPEPKDLNELENKQDWQAAYDRQLRAWTDDYSNLLDALPL